MKKINQMSVELSVEYLECICHQLYEMNAMLHRLLAEKAGGDVADHVQMRGSDLWDNLSKSII